MSDSRRSQLLAQALALPEDERLKLAEDLIISVKPPGVMSVDDPGFMDEIVRRSNSLHDRTAATISGEELMNKLDRIIAAHRRDSGDVV